VQRGSELSGYAVPEMILRNLAVEAERVEIAKSGEYIS